ITAGIRAPPGAGLTQALSVEPITGLLYISSGDGNEIVDPATAGFRHFSDLRVGSLAFDAGGKLWGAVWPERTDVVRFDHRGRVDLRLAFTDGAVDSIAFG